MVCICSLKDLQLVTGFGDSVIFILLVTVCTCCCLLKVIEEFLSRISRKTIQVVEEATLDRLLHLEQLPPPLW